MSTSTDTTVTTADGSVIVGVDPATPVRTNVSTATNTTPSPGPDQVFTAADIEKARQQEKDKVYGRLSAEQQAKKDLEERLAVLETERAERLSKEEAEHARLTEEAEAARTAQLTAEERIAEVERKFEERLAAERAERESERALLEKENAYKDFIAYKDRAIQSAQEDILPEFIDLVNGDSPESIDASIEALKAKTASVLANFQEAVEQQVRTAPGVRVTAPSGVEIGGADRPLTAAEIEGMTMEQFAVYRQKAGIARGSNNRGLFG